MSDTCVQIFELLKEKKEIVMATILKKSGSAPREEGTKMLIKKDFSIEGTIGGGLLEAMTMKLSSDVFDDGGYLLKDFSLSNQDASKIGMVCGGDVEILFEYLNPFDDDFINIYDKAAELRRSRINFFMITKVSKSNNYISGSDKWICTDTEFIGIEDSEVQRIVQRIREDFNHVKIQMIYENEKDRYLIEPFFHYEKVCIIGAGHVAQKLADLTKNLGFYTIVVDDREEFANEERFQTADEIKVIPSFDKLTNHISINHNSYIVIVTRGHSYDKEVLAQMLQTDAKYIGMIGSHSKRDHTYQELLIEGFTTKDLERVYCPIGTEIFAQTPEEIGISIAGELIKVRRQPVSMGGDLK